MNPENCGPHIVGKHSHMWRKSMFAEKPINPTLGCHKQLNEFSETINESWRTRNNFVKTNFSGVKRGSSMRVHTSAVDTMLKEEKIKSKASEAMIKSLMIDKQHFERSLQLTNGIAKLKEMKLLSGKELNNVKFPGVIKQQYVYNDYHTKGTNPGFSRGELGRVYSK